MGGGAHPNERRGRLSERIILGNLEGTVRKGRGEKKKE